MKGEIPKTGAMKRLETPEEIGSNMEHMEEFESELERNELKVE